MEPGKTVAPDPPCTQCVLAPQCPVATAAPGRQRPGAVPRLFARGTRLLREGERPASLLFIKSGLLGVRQTGMDGVERAIAVIGPGFLVGQPMVHGQAAVLSVQALIAVSVCELALPVLRRLMQQQGGGEPVCIARYTRQSVLSLAGWSQVVRMPGPMLRLASALRLIAAFQPASAIQLPSQAALAELLCVTRESVNRAWRELETRSIVRRRHARAVDLDMPALEKLLTANN